MSSSGVNPDLAVVGYAMWTAAGHDGPSSVAAMRAGVSGAAKANLWDYTSGDNLSAFRVHAHQWWEGPSFLPRLIAPVIKEARHTFDTLTGSSDLSADDVPVLINIAPPDRPDRATDLEKTVLDGLEVELAQPLPKGSAVLAGGRVGLPHLLAKANRQHQTHPFHILVGAESFLRQAIVAHYIKKGRLLCGANSSGFIAGEAASALIVCKIGTYKGPQLALTGMGAGIEASGDGGNKETPADAKGLTTAMRSALKIAKEEFYDIPLVMGDLNGEHFKFKELAYAVMRLDRVPPEEKSRRPREHVEHWNVVETIGEVGAALMPAAVGWAFEAGRSGYLPGERVIFAAGEDAGQRVAIVGEWQNG